jgi:hypothetical protein
MATKFKVQMLDIMEDWAISRGADAIDVDEASDWALENGRYERAPISAKQQCMQDMRRALQQASFLDPQGNKVRAKHAVRNWKGQQTTLYPDVRTGKPAMMKEAFRQSWDGIANDVKRHSIEKQSYDLNNPYGTILPMFNYDFNKQAEEARMTGEYDDTFHEDEDNSDSD